MAEQAAQVEAAIIGGGPIGIELAAGFKTIGVSSVKIEAGAIGSTFMWWAPGTRFFSSPERIEIAGVPMALTHQDKATREEYLSYLRGVVRQFDLRIETFTRAVAIKKVAGSFEIETELSGHGVGGPHEISDSPSTTGHSTKWRARHLILAIGNMHRPRLLDIPGEGLPHVSHYLQDPHVYFDQRVLIVGGKNSAVEAAIRLYRIGAQVAMSYRGSEFDPKRVKYWLRPELEWLISKQMIQFHPRTLVHAIDRDAVTLASVDDPSRQTSVPADHVLLLTGYEQDASLFRQLGIALEGDEQYPRFDSQTMQTNVAGCFVAGTAAGGSQKRAKLFIENSHVHARRIVRAIAGVDVPWKGDQDFGTLEQ